VTSTCNELHSARAQSTFDHTPYNRWPGGTLPPSAVCYGLRLAFQTPARQLASTCWLRVSAMLGQGSPLTRDYCSAGQQIKISRFGGLSVDLNNLLGSSVQAWLPIF